MLNLDFNKSISIRAEENEWTNDENHSKKLFSYDGRRETSLMRMKPNSQLSFKELNLSVEIIVTDGVYSNEYGHFGSGTYLRLPQEDISQVHTKEGCTFFRKVNYFTKSKKVITETRTHEWYSGYGNLMVMPLSEDGNESTALVKWPKGERFLPHKHWGGEEIFVLSGTFIDEHGRYPKGTWIRNPHMSEHFPFVEEETIIFVKTGHMIGETV